MSPDADRRIPQAPAEGNALHGVYPGCSDVRLYTAAVAAATELGFVVTHREDATTTFSFHARAPVGSWRSSGCSAELGESRGAAAASGGGRAGDRRDHRRRPRLVVGDLGCHTHQIPHDALAGLARFPLVAISLMTATGVIALSRGRARFVPRPVKEPANPAARLLE